MQGHTTRGRPELRRAIIQAARSRSFFSNLVSLNLSTVARNRLTDRVKGNYPRFAHSYTGRFGVRPTHKLLKLYRIEAGELTKVDFGILPTASPEQGWIEYQLPMEPGLKFIALIADKEDGKVDTYHVIHR